MKTVRYIFALLFVLAMVVSCSPNRPRPTTPTYQFDLGYVTRYGAFYANEGMPNNVYMLDLYSPGLRLNREGYMEGNGFNLCLSDVFTLPTDSVLQADVTYETDTTGRADSFLPGQDFEGNVNGAYLLEIKDGKIASITLFERGTFVLTNEGDTANIVFEMMTTGRQYCKALFRAPLYYIKPRK